MSAAVCFFWSFWWLAAEAMGAARDPFLFYALWFPPCGALTVGWALTTSPRIRPWRRPGFAAIMAVAVVNACDDLLSLAALLAPGSSVALVLILTSIWPLLSAGFLGSREPRTYLILGAAYAGGVLFSSSAGISVAAAPVWVLLAAAAAFCSSLWGRVVRWAAPSPTAASEVVFCYGCGMMTVGGLTALAVAVGAAPSSSDLRVTPALVAAIVVCGALLNTAPYFQLGRAVLGGGALSLSGLYARPIVTFLLWEGAARIAGGVWQSVGVSPSLSSLGGAALIAASVLAAARSLPASAGR